MKDITQKLRKIEEIRDELECHIWAIFSRYLKTEGILFNSPDDWQIEGDNIYFYGTDGCMGCYDNMSLNIPMRFFEDPDTAFAEYEKEIGAKKKAKIKKEQRAKKTSELATLKRLSKKYGGDDE